MVWTMQRVPEAPGIKIAGLGQFTVQGAAKVWTVFTLRFVLK